MRLRSLVLSLVVLNLAFYSRAGLTETASTHLDPNTPQGLEGGFWRIDHDFDPILRLKNILLKQPLTIVPSIYFADGTEYRLASVTLEPAGVAQVNIRFALQSAPASIKSHISNFGIASISYQWSWPAVIASIQNTDEIASLTFTSSFQADVQAVHAQSSMNEQQIVRGTWWLPTENADSFVVVGNSSLVPKSVQVLFSGRDGRALGEKQVRLAPHAAQMIQLSTVIADHRGTDSAGGIEIHYSGPERSIVSYAGVSDEAVGYSASPVLIEDGPKSAESDHVAIISAPGLMLGHPETEMAFPVGTFFRPYAILHNVSSQSRHVTLALTSQGDGGTPQTESLGFVDLAPGEVREFNFSSKYSQANQLLDGYASLSASFEGQDGDIRIQAGSVDQTQNYVFEVPASLEKPTASRTLCFWSVERDNDSMIAVWNYEAVSQDLVLTLHYAGGEYAIPIHLEPRHAYNLDVRSLINSRVPDSSGNVVPSYIDSGSAVLSNSRSELDRISVVVASSIFNVRNATCGTTCITCNGGVNITYTAAPVRVGVTQSAFATVQLTMGSGTVYNNPAGGAWHSSNTGIAAVNSNGLHTGVNVGTATSEFILQNVPVNTTICGPSGSITCPTQTFTAFAQIYVQPVVFSVQPLDLYLGQTGQFLVTGQGFSNAGTISGQISGNDIQGGSATGVTDTMAYIPFTVNCDAFVGPYGSLTISFGSGDGGGLLNLPFNLFVHMPSPPIPSIQFNGQPVSGSQPVVVGQQIALTASIPSLPRCMSLQSQQWTPPTGTAVGGYVNAAGSGSPDLTGGQVLPVPSLNGSSLSFYWAYPTPQNSTYQVSYQYTMSGGGQSLPSSLATAVFTVAGVTSPNITIQNYVLATVDDLSGCSIEGGGPTLAYGRLTGMVPVCGTTTGTPGITFTPSGNWPGTGNYFFVQTVDSDSSSNGYNSLGKTLTCTNTPGVDGQYPYQGVYNPPSRNDAPTMPLAYSPNASRAFNATMYLMWQSSTPNSIAVPVGSVPWTFNATATCSSGCGDASGWTPSGVGGPTNQQIFVLSSASQSNLGFPVWGGPATPQCTYH